MYNNLSIGRASVFVMPCVPTQKELFLTVPTCSKRWWNVRCFKSTGISTHSCGVTFPCACWSWMGKDYVLKLEYKISGFRKHRTLYTHLLFSESKYSWPKVHLSNKRLKYLPPKIHLYHNRPTFNLPWISLDRWIGLVLLVLVSGVCVAMEWISPSKLQLDFGMYVHKHSPTSKETWNRYTPKLKSKFHHQKFIWTGKSKLYK
jgi:hypothetical protein